MRASPSPDKPCDFSYFYYTQPCIFPILFLFCTKYLCVHREAHTQQRRLLQIAFELISALASTTQYSHATSTSYTNMHCPVEVESNRLCFFFLVSLPRFFHCFVNFFVRFRLISFFFVIDSKIFFNISFILLQFLYYFIYA